MKLYRFSILLRLKSLLLFTSLLCCSIALAKPLAPLQVRLAADAETLTAGQLAEFVITVRTHGQDVMTLPSMQLSVLSDEATQCDMPVLVLINQYRLRCEFGRAAQTWVRVEARIEQHGKQWQAYDQFSLETAVPPALKSAAQAGLTKWRGDRRIVEYGL